MITRTILISIFVISFSCKSQEFSKKIYDYTLNKNDSAKTTKQIYKNGKKSIPSLIDLIDVNRKGYPGYINKFSSRINFTKEYLGMNSAFMIELIISCETLKLPITRYEGTELKTQVEGISLGRIINKNSESLSIEDMSALKNVYLNWWNKKKNKTLQEIRNDWIAGDRPLNDSIFIWQ